MALPADMLVSHSPKRKKPTPAEIILALLRKDADGKYTNVFEILASPRVLKLAYEVIKSKPGNMVRGVTKETLDGITTEWFYKTSREILAERYKFRPNRRVYIPKANGKRRPIGIASPRDKIIQQATAMVMESVLEPKFHNSSHGFRPHRGCHTALRAVRSWKGVPWIIEGLLRRSRASLIQLTTKSWPSWWVGTFERNVFLTSIGSWSGLVILNSTQKEESSLPPTWASRKAV